MSSSRISECLAQLKSVFLHGTLRSVILPVANEIHLKQALSAQFHLSVKVSVLDASAKQACRRHTSTNTASSFPATVYGLSVIEDPTQANSRVAKDVVIVGQKASLSPEEEPMQLDLDNDVLLHSGEVSGWPLVNTFLLVSHSHLRVFL